METPHILVQKAFVKLGAGSTGYSAADGSMRRRGTGTAAAAGTGYSAADGSMRRRGTGAAAAGTAAGGYGYTSNQDIVEQVFPLVACCHLRVGGVGVRY